MVDFIQTLFQFTLPIAVISLVLFLLYSYTQKHYFFVYATISSIVTFLLLTLVNVGLLVEYGISVVSVQDARYFTFAWVLMLTYYIVGHVYRIRILGSIIMPFAFALLLMGSFTHHSIPAVRLYNLPTFVHVSLIYVALALLCISTGSAILKLLKEKSIRVFDIHTKLPAVNTLNKLMISSFLISFPFITISSLIGLIEANNNLTSNWLKEPKIFIGLLSWFLYSIIFLFYKLGKLNSRKLARSIIIVTVLFLGSYFLSTVYESKNAQLGLKEVVQGED
ncbi:MAG: cytochrome c biogenesis protein [Lentisphaeria bacterium]|nr:cytochrome c biogenesis protein [Lentisphaeria bacterium]